MMEVWLNEFVGLFLHFFGRTTSGETYAVIALCILLGALALSRISIGLGATGAFYTRGILLTCVGLAVVIASLALLPFIPFQTWWMVLAVPIAAILVVVLPLTALFQRSGYVTALIAWTVALLVIAVILTLEPKARQALEKGYDNIVNKNMKLEQHRFKMEKF